MAKNRGGFRGGGFGGGSGGGKGGGINMNMIKQAQKMQEDMLKMQAEEEEKTYSAQSGGGAVTAVVTGKRELARIDISPDAASPDDVEMLQDLIVAAVNEALRKAETSMSESMAKLTGGLSGMGLGF
ncbi:MAG: YbaB/EbfC family nucleoid-associated protein [Oscillospiraceae bacterium]|nr:YbaB/EbfC family nucleoid-associated protein [Oscillospiraceae bacterium]